MDISNHLNLINNHNCKGKIGILKKDGGLAWHKGDICLFEPWDIPNEYEADSSDIEHAKTMCNIEYPLSQKEIDDNQAQGSGIKTIRSCVAVPLNMIDEIKYR